MPGGGGGHVEASIWPIHKLTEVKYLMHIIILNDVRCFDGKKLEGWVYSHLSDQIRQDIHSLTDNSQNLWRAILYQFEWYVFVVRRQREY